MKKYIVLGVIVFSCALPYTHATTVTSDRDMIMCTMEYDPVCGQPTTPNCLTGRSCFQVMSTPKTYGNSCMMYADGATFLYKWECVMPPVEPSQESVIAWAYSKGLTRYSTVSDFRPELSMTRQEAAAFMARIAKNILGKDVDMSYIRIRGYNDANLIDPSLLDDVMIARYLGIMNGSNDMFAPTRILYRSEAIALLMRAVGGTTLDESGPVWYDEYRTQAAQRGLAVTMSDSVFEQPISRGEFMRWAYILTSPLSVSHPVNDTSLLGNWKLISFQKDKTSLVESMDSGTLTFESNRMSASLCNSHGGEYTAANGVLRVPSMISTLMYCRGTIGMIEGYFDLSNATYVINTSGGKDTLTITTLWGAIFTYQKEGQQPLPDPSKIYGDWYLVGYNTMSYADTKRGGYQNITMTLTQKDITATFCNRLWGSYSLDGNTFRNTQLISTKKACLDTLRMEMENNFVLEWARYEHVTKNFLVATEEPSETLTITTKAGNTYTFGKK